MSYLGYWVCQIMNWRCLWPALRAPQTIVIGQAMSRRIKPTPRKGISMMQTTNTIDMMRPPTTDA
jgi:hypothetical protein